jgi:hypothetical protein
MFVERFDGRGLDQDHVRLEWQWTRNRRVYGG